MSGLKPVIRELREAALKAGIHSRDRLHLVADNLDNHLDSVIRQVRDVDRPDGIVDVSLARFTRNPKHRSDEFRRQYDEQMDMLASTPVATWLKNRIEYLENGRTSASVRAQRDAREVALDSKVKELIDGRKSFEEATTAAELWLKTQSATHRLDGIAGGNATDISGVGDAGVNASLGSQWRSRVGDIDRAVIDFVNTHPGADLSRVYINVVLR